MEEEDNKEAEPVFFQSRVFFDGIDLTGQPRWIIESIGDFPDKETRTSQARAFCCRMETNDGDEPS